MARRTPLNNRSTARPDNDEMGDSVTDTNFGGEEEEEEGEEEEEEGEMTDAQRRRERGDAVDDGEEEEEEEEEGGEEEEEEEEGEEEEEEGEEEEEEEGEEEEEEEEADADELEALQAIAGTGGKMVPLARLNQVLEQNAKLVDAVLAARGGAVKDPAAVEEPEFDVKAKRKEYRTAIMDGDEAKAEALEAEIDAYTTRKAKSETEAAVSNSVHAALEKVQVQQTVAKMQARYPIFNDQSPDFDKQGLEDMLDLRNVYIARGMSMPEAIRKACEKIGGPVVAAAKGSKAKPAKKPSVAGKDNRSLRDKRRAAEAARRQPAALARTGTGDRAVSRMDYGEDGPSEAQIRRMSPKERAIARGDIVQEGRKRG